ncbi:hypothetical protein IFM89_007137 [Coptis chinensis]|uniref:KIB1-4 beta-propeller domain-containing protein n=1 Tax=Coptis chinensis TaxID=261450 RepID=A0A835HB66_9MAGN|nr:hypothetical protein IFM89_007137 [Coptis chinensis]
MRLAMKEDMDARDFGHLELPICHHQVAMPEKPTWQPVGRYLVESRGEVLLICRLLQPSDGKFRVTHSFQVFKLDLCQMVWVKLKSWGDLLIFIGKSDTISFLAKELGADIGNHIYFLNDEMYSLPKRNEWTHSSRRLCTFDTGEFSAFAATPILPSKFQ